MNPPGPADAARPWTPHDLRLLAVAVLGALVLFTYGLGEGALWDQDEPRYFQIAREVRFDDPWTLRLDGAPWFVHPPLFFWLQALTARLIGFTEVAARLWSALSGVALVAATFLLARFLYYGRGSSIALLAAAVAATSLQVLGQARLGVFDPTLVAFMMLSLYMALEADRTGSRRAYLWAWGWAGLATATKGPIGLALPAMLIVGLWLLRRDGQAWRRVPWAGLAIYAAVGLSWYVVGMVRYGLPFLRTAVGYYLFNRFFGVVENQPGPWWYYAPVLVLGAMPWTAFVPLVIVGLLRRRHEMASQVILLWCGLVVAFYSAAGTKLPNYILPVYPVLAIGIARLLQDLLDDPAVALRSPGRWAAALLPLPSILFALAVVSYGRIKYPDQASALAGPVALVAGVLAGGPLVAWGFLLYRRLRAMVAALILTPVLALPILVHHTLPAMDAFRPTRRIGLALAAHARPDDLVAVVRLPLAASLRFYSDHAVRWVEGRDDLIEALCAAPRAFVVTPDSERAWVRPLLPGGAVELVADAGVRVYRADRPASCARAPTLPR
ncbi:MAG: glycosyltransferase family 39 protein [Armatimonadota bacterium]|nr:glycosyltransferase family 39 protein [Armatimonadota bacterium]